MYFLTPKNLSGVPDLSGDDLPRVAPVVKGQHFRQTREVRSTMACSASARCHASISSRVLAARVCVCGGRTPGRCVCAASPLPRHPAGRECFVHCACCLRHMAALLHDLLREWCVRAVVVGRHFCHTQQLDCTVWPTPLRGVVRLKPQTHCMSLVC